MNYRVIIQPIAKEEMEEAYLWIYERAPESAVVWFNGLLDACGRLDTFPERCPLAPENEFFDEEIRQLLYGSRAGRYRILFEIRGNNVHILHVRHGAREWLGRFTEDL